VEPRIADFLAKTPVWAGKIALFCENSGIIRRRAETGFDFGTNTLVLLPVRTEFRRLLNGPLAPLDREMAVAESS
jgi:hypothetical protein